MPEMTPTQQTMLLPSSTLNVSFLPKADELVSQPQGATACCLPLDRRDHAARRTQAESLGQTTGAQVWPRALGAGGRSVIGWLEARLASNGSISAHAIRTTVQTFGMCQRAAEAWAEWAA